MTEDLQCTECLVLLGGRGVSYQFKLQEAFNLKYNQQELHIFARRKECDQQTRKVDQLLG